MGSGRTPRSGAPLFAATALSYGANCMLGAAVALKLIDTRDFRWVHHALYIATSAFTVAAVSAGWWGSPVSPSRPAAIALVPAVVPLAVIPYAGTRGRRHPLVALAAAPFVIAGLILASRPANRK
ncbi:MULTISPECIES: hypothetical protein [unclassified Microbacterium]|uniref:hypothetical protein n=1 Tax=unclassified Microbacterium TaxID=2609290 RepID=UPI000EA8C353|nr:MULTISPECIES: hypothetical protein [unclassified Microbacterium]MBT2484484.1 hypothetical protein [Microbacterium sp. ISL-108]RKN67390.1 hypothetical protein D7252_07215 [Microbacterium sp. CGR2]